MDYLKIYKSSKKNRNPHSLNETCKYFLNDYLAKEIINKFLENKVPNEEDVMRSLVKICSLEENTVFLPYEEITDILNFSIYTEREQILNHLVNEKVTKISKLSNILKKGLDESNYVNDQEVYSVEEVRDFILEKSNSITSDVVIKNSIIQVSFL